MPHGECGERPEKDGWAHSFTMSLHNPSKLVIIQ